MYTYEGYGIKIVVKIERETLPDIPLKPIQCPGDIYNILYNQLCNQDREICVVVLLDAGRRLLGINTVSIGSIDASIVNPREVFKPAILLGASYIVFAHNHPLGWSNQPSDEDIAFTHRLAKAGELLGIELIDHLIIADQGYQSVKQYCREMHAEQ